VKDDDAVIGFHEVIDPHIDPSTNIDSRIPKVNRYLLTRNRRGQPFTTEMDEIVDGEPTGKIVVGSRIVDGEYVPIYKGEEPEPKKAKKRKRKKTKTVDKIAPKPVTFIKWFNKQFGEQGIKPEVITENPKGEEYAVFILEFDWHYGHEKQECKTKADALKIKAAYQTMYVGEWTMFSNWKIYQETRFRTEVADKRLSK